MKREQEIFPYIAQLLNGAEVEWKPLGKVTEVKTGQSVNKNIIADNAGEYPVINSGREPLGFINVWNTDNDPIGITSRGAGVGSVTWQEGKYFRGNLNYSVSIKDVSTLNTRFLYHLLLQMQPEIHALCTFEGIPALNAVNLKKLQIPLPSLFVQQEIVRILDKFTQLEAELEAELDCRKRQYEYYRDKLLTSDEKQVEWKTLGEVAEVVTDFTAAGSFASNAKNVKYLKEPNYALLVRTTDLKKVFKNNEDFIYVDKHAFEYLWRVNLDKESIILPNVGNCGEVYYSIPQRLPYDNCVLGPNAILLRSCIVNNKYLYYLLQADDFQKDLSKITSTTGQTKFNKTNLKQIKIPIPPIEEQERIVGILDKFDTLVNSISEGLPREIELRRKQYEYYREKLLSFPKN